MHASILKFEGCNASERHCDPLYLNAFLKRLDCASDATGGGSIPYSGYQRALQLYGNEKAFDLTCAQRRNLSECKNLEMNRSIARKAGYNPDTGRSAPWAGVYFPNEYIMTYPGPVKALLKPPKTTPFIPWTESEEDLITHQPLLKHTDNTLIVPSHHPLKQQDLISCSPTKSRPALANRPALSPNKNNKDLEGGKPTTLRGMSGNRVPAPDDFANTCVGGMEMAVVVTELLERVAEGGLNDEWKNTVEETLNYIGGSENMYAFLDYMYKQFPKKEDTSPASTVGCRLRGSS